MKLVLSCEHGGNEIPQKFSTYFKEGNYALNSHRGIDFGALNLFNKLKDLADFSLSYTYSRLLIELNRSINHPNLYSEFTKNLNADIKHTLIKSYYLPYRNEIEEVIVNYVNQGEKVVHISVHSFTPVLNGEERNADIGLLFDSSRDSEKSICKELKKEIKLFDSNLNVRFNYPYLGKADGFTTYLRKRNPIGYLGIEIEVNQEFATNNMMDRNVSDAILHSIKKVCT